MSGRGGGVNNNNGKGNTGISGIPAASRKMVQSLKEIVNCPEPEIYAMLKECNMDPNEAVNRLLSQDPFHEVKSKREKKKENKDSTDSRPRGANNMSNRGGRGGADRNGRGGPGRPAYFSSNESSTLHSKPSYKKENGANAYAGPSPSASAADQLPKVAATAAPEPVLDVSGKILRTGTSYYILPVVRGRGGGLKMASTGRRTCPLDVVQDRYEASNGLPLKLTPVNTKKGVVRVHTDLNISFSAASICHQSTAWKLDSYDQWTKQWFVTTNGVEGNPGPETTNNWFKIEKFEDKYKLVFCPTVCQHCKVMCKDIGIFVDAKGVRRLALSSVPLKVMFKMA